MPIPPSRQAVLDLIRRGARTVNAIADALRVTDNAVRGHLVALERDGLIARAGLVRSGGAGQPAAEYELTPSGELALSAAYAPALAALAAAAGERLDPRARRALFLDAGRRLAATLPAQDSGSLADRASACATLIDALGGSTEVSVKRGVATITGHGCPLSASVRAEPATCMLIEGMLEQHAGVDAVQRCEHGDRPACRFDVR